MTLSLSLSLCVCVCVCVCVRVCVGACVCAFCAFILLKMFDHKPHTFIVRYKNTISFSIASGIHRGALQRLRVIPVSEHGETFCNSVGKKSNKSENNSLVSFSPITISENFRTCATQVQIYYFCGWWKFKFSRQQRSMQ